MTKPALLEREHPIVDAAIERAFRTYGWEVASTARVLQISEATVRHHIRVCLGYEWSPVSGWVK